MRSSKVSISRRPRQTALAIGAAGSLLTAALGAAWLAGLRVNDTESMPRGLWRVAAVSAPLRRGEIVAICLPDTAAVQEAVGRGYISAGTCHGGFEPLLKPVGAIAGDLVTVTPRRVLVDGQPVANTAQLARDSAGRPLRPFPAGDYPVAPGQVWLLSGHNPRSFDSRYFGPVPAADVVGVARPFWVLE